MHIGWKGLQQKFAGKVLREVFADSITPVELFVGPAAGASNYEFGLAELKLIGEHAVAKEVDGKLCLDMVETLAAEVQDFENIEIFSSQICTIQNNQFHSHRREPNIKLRNLTAYIF